MIPSAKLIDAKAVLDWAGQLKSKLDRIQDADLSLANKMLVIEARQACSEIQKLLVQKSDSLTAPKLSEEKSQNKKVIMIVDDDQDIQRTMAYLLSKKGDFQVVCIVNSLEAIEAAKSQRPDAILMDLMMPNMTGFELLQKIKADASLNSIKIIIGSSRSYDKDKISVLEAGADDFIAKPYNFAELLLRLKHLVGT